MQAVNQRVVYMNGDRHGATPFALCHLAKGDPWDRIVRDKVPGMRQGREIEPWKHREMDQVLRRGWFKIVSLPNALHFGRSLENESTQIRMKTIVCEPDGSVGPVHRTVAVDLPVQPDFAIDDAGAEILDLLRGQKGTMNQREKHGKAMVLRIAISSGAIDANAHSVEGLSKCAEEIENCRTIPCVRVDFLPGVLKRTVHGIMIPSGDSGHRFNRMDRCGEPCRFSAETHLPHCERGVA